MDVRRTSNRRLSDIWCTYLIEEGESKEVGAKVIYQGREMVVSKGVDFDDEMQNRVIDYLNKSAIRYSYMDIVLYKSVMFVHRVYRGDFR